MFRWLPMTMLMACGRCPTGKESEKPSVEQIKAATQVPPQNKNIGDGGTDPDESFSCSHTSPQ